MSSECPLCGEPPHSDWRTDPLGGNHRDAGTGLVGAEPGDSSVNDYLLRIRQAGAYQDTEARP